MFLQQCMSVFDFVIKTQRTVKELESQMYIIAVQCLVLSEYLHDSIRVY